MGQTIIEKIFSAHTKDEVRPGVTVQLSIDARIIHDRGGARIVEQLASAESGADVASPERAYFTLDCFAPATDAAHGTDQQRCRDFAVSRGIRIFDVHTGIGTHVLVDEGIALPGGTVTGMGCSLAALGAVGCFGHTPSDEDAAAVFATGKARVAVPETLKITLRGKVMWPARAKDVALFLLGKIGREGARGKALELAGEVAEAMTLSERLTVSALAAEMGAVSALFPPDDAILEYCRRRSAILDLDGLQADSDASYCEEYAFDVSTLAPQVACPPSPDNVMSVSDAGVVPVNSVLIGSCAGGRYEDFDDAARAIAGRRVAPGVIATIRPATREIFGRMLKDGLLALFFDSGFVICAPGCSGCMSGQVGVTGRGEVQASTGTRNEPCSHGAGDTYLVSPAVAGASAVAGRLAQPL